MYILTFKQNKSKYFPEAISFAQELGGELKDGIVRIEIKDVLNAYSVIRTLFSFIQNWKGTSATYNGRPVHPYRFLLQAHWIRDCSEERAIDKDCGDQWGCRKIDKIKYHIPYQPFKSHTYWYSYGKFQSSKWVIDKEKIYQILLKYAKEKAIDTCPLFEEIKLRIIVGNLPDYIIPDEITFTTIYSKKYVEGQEIKAPTGVMHLPNKRLH